MKKGDASVVETLRFLIAAVQNEAIRKYGADAHANVSDDDVMNVIKKQIKTHKESIEMFEKAKRAELAAKEKAQLEILMRYVPVEMTDDELEKLLAPIAEEVRGVPAGRQDFGPLMGKAMAAIKGRADGQRVSRILRTLMAARGSLE